MITSRDKMRKVWIIVLAFAILAVLGGLVWLVFSGETNQRIRGDNLENFRNTPTEPTVPSY